MRKGSGPNGCTFTATTQLNVTHLCRWPAPGADNVVPVAISEGTTGRMLGSVSVDARASATAPYDELGFACTELAERLTLRQGAAYVLESSNDPPCDSWYDDTSAEITVFGGAQAAVKSVYGEPTALQPGGGGANHCYGPLSFHFEH